MDDQIHRVHARPPTAAYVHSCWLPLWLPCRDVGGCPTGLTDTSEDPARRTLSPSRDTEALPSGYEWLHGLTRNLTAALLEIGGRGGTFDATHELATNKLFYAATSSCRPRQPGASACGSAATRARVPPSSRPGSSPSRCSTGRSYAWRRSSGHRPLSCSGGRSSRVVGDGHSALDPDERSRDHKGDSVGPIPTAIRACSRRYVRTDAVAATVGFSDSESRAPHGCPRNPRRFRGGRVSRTDRRSAPSSR